MARKEFATSSIGRMPGRKSTRAKLESNNISGVRSAAGEDARRRRRYDEGKLSFAKKIGLCLIPIGFAIVVKVMSASGSMDDFRAETMELASRGVTVEARLVETKAHNDGEPHQHLQYEYTANGKPYRYPWTYYPKTMERPGQTKTVTYLPESPDKAREGVADQVANYRAMPYYDWGLVVLGLVLMAITIARKGANDEREKQRLSDLALAAPGAPSPNPLQGVNDLLSVDRVFDYRMPGSLFLFLFLFGVPLLFMVGGGGAALRGEVNMNGVPGDGTPQYGALVMMTLLPSPFLIIGIYMLLAYLNEQIIWRNGTITWIDRRGRQRVSCPITEIKGVRRSRVYVNNLERIHIDTPQGDIRFLDSAPWAEVLEEWAEKVVGQRSA